MGVGGHAAPPAEGSPPKPQGTHPPTPHHPTTMPVHGSSPPHDATVAGPPHPSPKLPPPHRPVPPPCRGEQGTPFPRAGSALWMRLNSAAFPAQGHRARCDSVALRPATAPQTWAREATPKQQKQPSVPTKEQQAHKPLKVAPPGQAAPDPAASGTMHTWWVTSAVTRGWTSSAEPAIPRKGGRPPSAARHTTTTDNQGRRRGMVHPNTGSTHRPRRRAPSERPREARQCARTQPHTLAATATTLPGPLSAQPSPRRPHYQQLRLYR